MTGRNGWRAVQNVGGTTVCSFARRGRQQCDLPQVAECVRLPLAVLGEPRDWLGHGRRRRRHRRGRDGRLQRHRAAVHGSVCRHAADPRRRGERLRPRRRSPDAHRRRADGRGMRSRSRTHGFLDRGCDIAGHELERRRHARRADRGRSTRKQEERQGDRRCCESGGDTSGDGDLQPHPGRPRRPQREGRFDLLRP